MLKGVLVFVAGVGVGLLLGSGWNTPQRDASPAESVDPAVAESTEDAEAARKLGLSLSPRTHDFGHLLEGQASEVKVRIERPADTPLVIGRLYSPCPCIRVTSDKTRFTADESAEIKVEVHSLTLLDDKSFPFYVEVREPGIAVLRGDVSVHVERVPAKILLEPEGFRLGAVRGSKTATVRLWNLTKRPMAIQTLACALPNVKVSALEKSGIEAAGRIPAGGFVAITLDIPEDALETGPITGTVSLETDSPENARIEIPVEGIRTR